MPVSNHLFKNAAFMPTVSYFLSTTDHPIHEDHPLWSRSLPENWHSGAITPETDSTDDVTYGIYFTSIFKFCAADGWRRLLTAASEQLDLPVAETDLGHLSIFLEKHGGFYHPARLQLDVSDRTLTFVVNVAASGRGRQALPREVAALSHLNAQRPFGWFPRVYHHIYDALPMFMGDWLDGFHEFHLTRRTDNDKLAMVIWDGAEDRCLLSTKQERTMYRKAAMILTACYDPVSSCQIFPWHHAAGDFVIRVDGEKTSVKMITVRDYVPMAGIETEPDSEQAILDALVIFFIHLSVRMRLDRLDGVNEVVWAPDACLAPVIQGFFQGLDLTARISGFPEGFADAFRHYFNHNNKTDLMATAQQVTEAVFDAQAEERCVIDSNLTDHMGDLCRRLSA
jgi:hypothetical protein